MGTTFTKLLYHIVFSTKERIPSIRKDVRDATCFLPVPTNKWPGNCVW
jgi:hypothetical protein